MYDLIKQVTIHRNDMDKAHRAYYIVNFGWSIPTKQAVDKVNDFVANDQVLEIGAGAGLWAHLLSMERNIDCSTKESYVSNAFIHAVDNHSTHYHHTNTFYYVQDMDWKQAIDTHDTNCLMLIWPPCGLEPNVAKNQNRSNMSHLALKYFKGDKLIYIGDTSCTGSSKFHSILYKKWKLVKIISIPTWRHLSDKVYLYRRKKNRSFVRIFKNCLW